MSEKQAPDGMANGELAATCPTLPLPVETSQTPEDDGDEHKERHRIHGNVIRYEIRCL